MSNNNADDQIDELIKLIALNNKMAVDRNDPIMVLQTIYGHLLSQSESSHDRLFTRLQEELENIASQWESNATMKAEKILSTSLTHQQKIIDEALYNLQNEAHKKINVELDASINAIRKEQQKLSLLLFFVFLASFITFGTAVILLLELSK